jgi:hypothetical protein
MMRKFRNVESRVSPIDGSEDAVERYVQRPSELVLVVTEGADGDEAW